MMKKSNTPKNLYFYLHFCIVQNMDNIGICNKGKRVAYIYELPATG